MDLFDMQLNPGGPEQDHRFVLHFVDHFTRFSILRAIKNKEMETIRDVLFDIFTNMGAPTILQTDNGSEFKNSAVQTLCNEWNDSHIHGRAYHPQSQGSVERANGLAKAKLQAWIATQGAIAGMCLDWIPGLKLVQSQMNHQWRRCINTTRCSVVQGRRSRVDQAEQAKALGARSTASHHDGRSSAHDSRHCASLQST
jgi:IS30 family transposase